MKSYEKKKQQIHDKKRSPKTLDFTMKSTVFGDFHEKLLTGIGLSEVPKSK